MSTAEQPTPEQQEAAEQTFRIVGSASRDLLQRSPEAQKALEALSVAHILRQAAWEDLFQVVSKSNEQLVSNGLSVELVLRFLDGFSHEQSVGGSLLLSSGMRGLLAWAKNREGKLREAILAMQRKHLQVVCSGAPLLPAEASREQQRLAATHGLVVVGQASVIGGLFGRICDRLAISNLPWTRFSETFGEHPVPAIAENTLQPHLWYAAGDSHAAVKEAWARLLMSKAAPAVFLLDNLNEIRRYPMGFPGILSAALENLQTVQRLLASCYAAKIVGLVVSDDERKGWFTPEARRGEAGRSFKSLTKMAAVVQATEGSDGEIVLTDSRGCSWTVPPNLVRAVDEQSLEQSLSSGDLE